MSKENNMPLTLKELRKEYLDWLNSGVDCNFWYTYGDDGSWYNIETIEHHTKCKLDDCGKTWFVYRDKIKSEKGVK